MGKIAVAELDEIRQMIREVIREEMSEFRHNSADPYLSAKQAARHVRVRNDVILKALTEGSLKGQRRGKSWRIKVSDLESWRG